MSSVRHLHISVRLLITSIAIDTFGYSFIEEWPAFDITLSGQPGSCLTIHDRLKKLTGYQA